ncbi:MAG TPA: hypothetical protein VG407_12120 [Caulobacteraceae bacterium]|jgi:hypothetical protein|nr:hypothetical protein [Caulobacteraceae bacterium]
MKETFEQFWWLLFPAGFFLVILLSSFMSYQRRKAELDVLKSYIQQGKDPPPELTKALGGSGAPDPMAGPDAYGHPYYGPYGGWGWRRYRYGPYWEWRRAIVMGAVSGGFYMAYRYSDSGTGHAFLIVSIITGVVAAASLLFALVQSLMPPPPR